MRREGAQGTVISRRVLLRWERGMGLGKSLTATRRSRSRSANSHVSAAAPLPSSRMARCDACT